VTDGAADFQHHETYVGVILKLDTNQCPASLIIIIHHQMERNNQQKMSCYFDTVQETTEMHDAIKRFFVVRNSENYLHVVLCVVRHLS